MSFFLFLCVRVAVSGAEDVALYVGIVAVALCLTLLLVVLVLVYRRKKEGLDADVADSSILTTGFQPVGIKPAMPGVWAPDRAQRCSTITFLLQPSLCRLPDSLVFHPVFCVCLYEASITSVISFTYSLSVCLTLFSFFFLLSFFTDQPASPSTSHDS